MIVFCEHSVVHHAAFGSPNIKQLHEPNLALMFLRGYAFLFHKLGQPKIISHNVIAFYGDDCMIIST